MQSPAAADLADIIVHAPEPRIRAFAFGMFDAHARVACRVGDRSFDDIRPANNPWDSAPNLPILKPHPTIVALALVDHVLFTMPLDDLIGWYLRGVRAARTGLDRNRVNGRLRTNIHQDSTFGRIHEHHLGDC